MDDIRNTSALFVGGQDTAPHTERTARALWQLLFQKTEDEISAMATCRAELMALGEDLSREKMLFLLRQEKPLELLSEAWMERRTMDEGELFQSLLIEVYEDEHQQLLNEPLML